ncbi:MAG TPA: flagellar brake domain-containing protein [Chloroflexota bacterium]|jgi:c-di-GMP-binding flagellar brake protein YcgR
MTGLFEAGMAAEIEVNGLTDKYATKIEAVRGDYLSLATPKKAREYIKLDYGQRILLSVLRRNNPYFFDTFVLGNEWSEGQLLTQIRRPPENAGVQLRQHVRVAVVISDAQFWWEGRDGKFGPTLPGQLLDISAGGFLALSRDGLPEGLILARFTLSRQAGHLMSLARVLKDYERVSDVGVRSHRSHCQFVDMAEKDRERLVRFVFQRERELRQKGVL